TNVKGNFEAIPITSKLVTIHNLLDPFLRFDIKAETDLSSFNQLLSSSSFDFIGGKMKADFSYAGALKGDTSTSINGFLDIIEGSILYHPRTVKLEHINGKLVFDSTDVLIKDLQGEAQANKVKINAVIKNMINLLTRDPSKLLVDADISSPSLDLYSFKTMLGTRKKRAGSMKGKFAKLAEKIDHFMDDCSISTRLKAAQVKYKNFVATNLEAALSINANKWNLQKVVLQNSDGSISLNGTLTSLGDNNNAIDFEAEMRNVNVSKLFVAFNNFGLASLHAENIKGSLTSKAQLHAILDDESRLIPSTLTGTMDLSLTNGELINFEPLQKMAVFVLKKRDFSRVEFAEIKNTFEINGQMLSIHKMEVQSNVLGLYVDGMYDLQGKNTDLVVQVPLKYLKKREPGYVPENQGLDAKTGVSVFVRAKNADNGQIDFKYGIFKKKSGLEKTKDEQAREAKKTTFPLIP
ncbi:MAG TPA: AsmA-like C-terminal region-containing protein, partial [Chitinophagaceae bacterium]|nr:AsmA-like C-terminal region-containing protein [Chitinophagaceae bacterium]